MKICFICTSGFPHITPYVNYFSGKGHQVYLITIGNDTRKFEGVTLINTHPEICKPIAKWKYILAGFKASRIIKAIQPDIIHGHYATSAGIIGLIINRHPFIVSAHGTDLVNGHESIVWRYFLKKIFNFADIVHVVSKDLKIKAENLCSDQSKIITLPIGINLEKFQFNRITPAKELRLISTRRLEPVYNYEVILNAIHILKPKIPIRLTIIGGGSQINDLKKLCKDLNINDVVHFKGQIDNELLPSELKKHNVYLSASKWDGTSLSLLEAMATGLFPIISDIIANRSLIKDGYNGFLHKTSDPIDLANKITDYYFNSSNYVLRIEENRTVVENIGDSNKNMGIIENKYAMLTSYLKSGEK